jgi:DUF4097 and DUF4098 domain-containing protein YvlB
MIHATFNRLLTAAVLGTLVPAAHGQTTERIVVPLSEPGLPARLEIAVLSGDIVVEAYDGNEIVIVTDEPVRGRDSEDDNPRADGLRRIQSSSVGLTVEEAGNTVAIRMDFSANGVDLQVQVPRQTSVRANLINGGDIAINGVNGEHELSNVNGDVIATDISGSAVFNSTNGDVRASFAAIETSKPMSLTSFNGDVDVALPADLAADLRVATQQGEVFTDFDVAAEPDPTTIERGGDAGGRYRVRMQRMTRYAIGGGGTDIQLRTFNGDILIRKR